MPADVVGCETGASTTSDYGGKNQTTSKTLNVLGLTASVADAASATTTYGYDAFGDLTTVTDPASHTTTNVYDVAGFRTDSYDPDMGHWTYGYDVLGQLTSQTDAKSQSTSLSYDVLGRPTSRGENNLYSTWVYGISSANHNILRPIEAKACTTSSCSTVVADRTFTYDGYGRPATTTLVIDGSNHTYTQGYDSNGLLSTVAYPSGFTAQYVYTAYGYQSQIKDNNSGAAYWTANSRDAEMHLTAQTFGNGVSQTTGFDANTGLPTSFRAGPSDSVAAFDYSWDHVGNLNYRSDNRQGVFEYACYDNLDRLTQYAVGNAVTACTSSQNQKTVSYDSLGNIATKTGVGSYTSGSGAGPHAVTSIAGTVNGVVNPTYAYDANGSMISGAGRTVTPTAFNMAASIVQGSTTVSLVYDSEHDRVKMVAPPGTTYYLKDPATGTISEKLVSGANTTWHDYIVANGHVVAEKFSGVTSAVRYLVSDHLGSTAVVTDEAGAVVERNAYDPWGKRRNLDGSDDTSCALNSITTRGFTGHEHIDSECLINMNARVYDPTIGRFMSADVVVPDAADGQAYNRYSYVQNGVLSATDPTGHVLEKLTFRIKIGTTTLDDMETVIVSAPRLPPPTHAGSISLADTPYATTIPPPDVGNEPLGSVKNPEIVKVEVKRPPKNKIKHKGIAFPSMVSDRFGNCHAKASYEGSFGAQGGGKVKLFGATIGLILDGGSVRTGYDAASGESYTKYTQGVSISLKWLKFGFSKTYSREAPALDPNVPEDALYKESFSWKDDSSFTILGINGAAIGGTKAELGLHCE